VDSGYFAVWKGGGVELRGRMRVFVEPEADGVLWGHGLLLLVGIRVKDADLRRQYQ
jgi:hypothetical protein